MAYLKTDDEGSYDLPTVEDILREEGIGKGLRGKTSVVMSSDEFGGERFNYDTPREALAGLVRVAASAMIEAKKDGIKRSFTIMPTRQAQAEGY